MLRVIEPMPSLLSGIQVNSAIVCRPSQNRFKFGQTKEAGNSGRLAARLIGLGGDGSAQRSTPRVDFARRGIRSKRTLRVSARLSAAAGLRWNPRHRDELFDNPPLGLPRRRSVSLPQCVDQLTPCLLAHRFRSVHRYLVTSR